MTALGCVPARVCAQHGTIVHVDPPQLVQISLERQGDGDSFQPTLRGFLQPLAVSVLAVELFLGHVLAVVALSLRDPVALRDREHRKRDASRCAAHREVRLQSAPTLFSPSGLVQTDQVFLRA
tara:strand:+ start:2806 stop:3174 length:369 start_codon:yes stop_codon:yes gene_type:complete|eukprot:31135-Pelagococcus_subviridis.AAC.15